MTYIARSALRVVIRSKMLSRVVIEWEQPHDEPVLLILDQREQQILLCLQRLEGPPGLQSGKGDVLQRVLDIGKDMRLRFNL